MNSIIISIKPKHTHHIIGKTKLLEIRKTKPKIDIPFKCYVYETKDYKIVGDKKTQGRGNLICDFVCNEIKEFEFDNKTSGYNISGSDLKSTKLHLIDLYNYGLGERLYGYAISELNVYKHGVPISVFGLTRPPQSWCYLKQID